MNIKVYILYYMYYTDKYVYIAISNPIFLQSQTNENIPTTASADSAGSVHLTRHNTRSEFQPQLTYGQDSVGTIDRCWSDMKLSKKGQSDMFFQVCILCKLFINKKG